MNSRIQHKIDTSENWAKAENFIPLDGELIIYSDLRRIKIGDGNSYVNDLNFMDSGNSLDYINAIDDDGIISFGISSLPFSEEVAF